MFAAMTYYFYDLETSGFWPRRSRIMQFAGQRMDTNLQPIGEPDNFLIKLTDDVLPDPDAVLVHGITPQTARADGISEAEFSRRLTADIAREDTVFIGFNNIRFDDEFIRFTLWRNFYDAYEWQWQGNCSRWDLLDVIRMMRALRPDGIKWPFDSDGKPANRLELLAAINKLEHGSAHDALSDVRAIIALARLIRNKQPKLFDYLLRLRDKKRVRVLVEKGDPLIYASGRYPAEFEKTTVAVMVTPAADGRGALMYDLRVDPTPYLELEPLELATAWQYRPPRDTQVSQVQGDGEQRTEMYKDGTSKEQPQPATPQLTTSISGAADSASRQADVVRDAGYFPVKVLGYNRCPAVAPLSVLDKTSESRLKLDLLSIQDNLKTLKKAKDFGEKLLVAQEIMYPKDQTEMIVEQSKVDELLYEGFVSKADGVKMSAVRAADAASIRNLMPDFADERLKLLFPLYKARNFPRALTTQEAKDWQSFKYQRLLAGGEQSSAANYFKRIDELATRRDLTKKDKNLLEELKLYGQSFRPVT